MSLNSENQYSSHITAQTDAQDKPRLLDKTSRLSGKKLNTSYTERQLGKVERWIKQGRGQGRHDHYVPWIRITRGFSSPVSHQVFAELGVHERNHHFLSNLEHYTALQLAYLGATEIRECLPMWPMEHVHPLDDAGARRVPGLMALANEAGIDHGNFIGTDVPYIASLDMLVTVPWSGCDIHVGVSCKPDALLNARKRAQERTRLDELYCQAIGVRHLKEGGSQFNVQLLRNLMEFKPMRPEIQQWEKTDQLKRFSEELNRPTTDPLHLCIARAGQMMGVDHQQASALWRVGMWRRMIDVDIGKPISMMKPMQRGGESRVQELAQHFLGVEA